MAARVKQLEEENARLKKELRAYSQMVVASAQHTVNIFTGLDCYYAAY